MRLVRMLMKLPEAGVVVPGLRNMFWAVLIQSISTRPMKKKIEKP
jgi:hypothetical protein